MFHGIAELRKAGDGYVYWRSVCVDHFSYLDNEEEREREAAHQLAQNCLALEARGQSVSWGALMEYRIFDGCKAPLVAQIAGLCIAARFEINGVCDAPYIANTIAHHADAWEPYFTSGPYIFVETDPMGQRCDAGYLVDHHNPDKLTVDELRTVTDRPWGGRCATSGATMHEFADSLAPVDAPPWMKRAAVSICRSYSSSFDWREEVATVAAIIRDIFAAFGAPAEGSAP